VKRFRSPRRGAHPRSYPVPSGAPDCRALFPLQTAVFLIGGYAHYAVPHVWVRAGHSLLGTFPGSDSYDSPIQLQSTVAWRERLVHVHELVAELVNTVVSPQPCNPFELEPAFLQGTTDDSDLLSGLLLSGALCAFLRDVHLGSTSYAGSVEPDLLRMIRVHAKFVNAVAPAAAGQAVGLTPQRSSRDSGGLASPRTPYVPRISPD